jgi:hypothetical protein
VLPCGPWLEELGLAELLGLAAVRLAELLAFGRVASSQGEPLPSRFRFGVLLRWLGRVFLNGEFPQCCKHNLQMRDVQLLAAVRQTVEHLLHALNSLFRSIFAFALFHDD